MFPVGASGRRAGVVAERGGAAVVMPGRGYAVGVPPPGMTSQICGPFDDQAWAVVSGGRLVPFFVAPSVVANGPRGNLPCGILPIVPTFTPEGVTKKGTTSPPLTRAGA